MHSRQQACGIIQDVDLVGRELNVRLLTGEAKFDVPPNCPVWLHGERIKLRLVQPGDRVAIQFAKRSERLVVERLDVQPN